jgi:hypothetical protein
VACPTNKECTKPGNQGADCRCKAVCTMGQKKCDGASLSECVNVDGCPAWKTTACAAGQACAMAGNTASCGCPADSCKIGEKRCQGVGVVQECKGTGACGTWQAAATCPSNQECTSPGNQGAACRCKTTCTLNETKCTGGANTAPMQTCKTGPNGCNQFEDTPCDNGAICSPGAKPSCVCPGGADACKAGDERCIDGNKHQACRVSGQCGIFVDAPCLGNTQCKAGDKGKDLCVAACTNKCTVDETKCVGTGAAAKVQKCVDPDGAGPQCADFKDSASCTPDEKCQDSIPKKALCCPAKCVDVCDTDPKKIKKCKVDPNTGCTVPIAENCSAGTCKKDSLGVAMCGN